MVSFFFCLSDFGVCLLYWSVFLGTKVRFAVLYDVIFHFNDVIGPVVSSLECVFIY